MSRTTTIILVLVASMVFLGVGFAVGQVVQAAIAIPGGPNDPVVTEKYVNELVGEKTAELQTQIDELTAQIDALTGMSTIPPSTPTSTPTSVPTSTPTSTPTSVPTSTPATGTPSGTPKSVTITGSAVNVRASASTSADILTQVVRGDSLPYISSVNAADGIWYQITLPSGTTGWVFGSLAQLVY